MEENGIWKETINIPAYQAGPDGRIRLTALCNCLQETAGHQATHHQLGYHDMKNAGQFWVLNRLRVSIQQYPIWDDNITLHTWVNNMKGPFSYRSFEVYNEEQEVIATACTLWVLLDTSTRKPTRITKHTLPIIDKPTPACGEPEKILQLQNAQLISTHQVKNSDLDIIGHVNNVKYIEWITDLPPASSQHINYLEVNYLKETFPEEEVDIFQSLVASTNELLFILRKKEVEVCRIKIGFKIKT